MEKPLIEQMFEEGKERWIKFKYLNTEKCIEMFGAQYYKQDKNTIDSMKLHQSIKVYDIDTVTAWKSHENQKELKKEQVEKIIKGFNDSEIGEEKGDFYDFPTAEAGVTILLTKGHKINVSYVEGVIYVVRTDVRPSLEVSYHLKTIDPKLEEFFKELVD